ncbi:MAG TPA: helix-turn-helix transcriptional regulator [Actinospica sp.]|jgi:transcriptional regulator with XRE-family HTH domain|nr:helix-turn-helix transcriptional regulator [Actinospica sp.]
MTSTATVKSAARRTELAEFLRSRRERITPELAGLPPAPRRRTPGLRREEVAQLAGVGITWYTWLEQGRPINASTQVLDALARTLQLDGAEHQHLYTLARVPNVKQVSAPGCELPKGVQEILDSMGHMATVVNERFDMIATNGGFNALFPSVLAQRKKERNSLLCTFSHPECCHPFVNWHETIPPMVAALRASYARHIGEPYWDDFIRKLIKENEYFAELWSRNEVAGFGQLPRVFFNPAVGILRFTATSFGIHSAPGMRMQIFVPVDEETRVAHRRLLSGEARPPEVLPCGHSYQQWLESAGIQFALS